MANSQHDTPIPAHALPDRVTLPAEWFYGALVALLALAALGLDLFFMTGFISSDDCQYSAAAEYILKVAPPATPSIYPPYFSDLRLGVVLPAALIQRLTNENIVFQAYWFSLFHAGLIIAVYHLGRALHNRRVGALSAALVTFCPTIVLYAGTVLPDIPQTMFLVLGVVALVAARRRGFWGGFGLALASGFLVGLAYMAKETALIAMPVLGLALLIPSEGRRWPRCLADSVAISLGLLLFFGVETLTIHAIHRQWIFRPAMSQSNYGLDYARKMGREFFHPLHRYYWFRDCMQSYMGRLYLPYLAAIPLYPFLKRRSWTLWSLLVWLGVYFLWGSASLKQYIPQFVQPRYFIPCLPLAAIALAGLADGAGGWVWRRRRVAGSRALRGLALAVFIAVGAWVFGEGLRISNIHAGTPHYARFSDEIARALDQALTGSDLPVLMTAPDAAPLFVGWPVTRRLIVKPNAVCTRQELAGLLGHEGMLVLTRDDMPDNATSFEAWATRRKGAGNGDKVDVAAEAQLASFGSSELFDAQRIGFYPSLAGMPGGRLEFFWRSIGWRAGNLRDVFLNAPKVNLYRVRPTPATRAAAYQVKPLFALAQAPAGADPGSWIGCGAGVRLDSSAGAVRAAWPAGSDPKGWLSIPGGPMERPPAPLGGDAGFPFVSNPGRQVTFRLRALAGKPVTVALETVQYDGRGQLPPAGPRRDLAVKTIQVGEKSQEFVFNTLLEPATKSIRLRLALDSPPGTVLILEDLQAEQMAM